MADGSQYPDSAGKINPERPANMSEDDIRRCREIAMRLDARAKTKIRAILHAVAAETEIPVRDILGQSRNANVAGARQLVMFMASRDGFSAAAIGRVLNRDHTTVLHGIKAEKARRGE